MSKKKEKSKINNVVNIEDIKKRVTKKRKTSSDGSSLRNLPAKYKMQILILFNYLDSMETVAELNPDVSDGVKAVHVSAHAYAVTLLKSLLEK